MTQRRWDYVRRGLVAALVGVAGAACAAPDGLPAEPHATGADVAACRDVRAVIGAAAVELPALARTPVPAAVAFTDFAASVRSAAAGGSDDLLAAVERVAGAYERLADAAARGSVPSTDALRGAVGAFTEVCGLSDSGALP